MPSEMGQAALERMNAAQSTPPAEPAPPAPPEQDPGAPPPQTAEPQGAQPQQQPDEGYEDFEYGGEKHQMSRSDRHYLMTLGLEAYQQLLASREAAQEAQPQQQPGQEQEHPIFAEVRSLKAQLGKFQSEQKKQEVIRNTELAIEGNEFLAGWAKRQPGERKPLMAEVIQFQAAHPRMSYENAAKAVEKRWKERFKADRATYAQEKIEAAGRRTETGGQFPVQTPKFGRKEFKSGAIKSAATERAERYAATRR